MPYIIVAMKYVFVSFFFFLLNQVCVHVVPEASRSHDISVPQQYCIVPV